MQLAGATAAVDESKDPSTRKQRGCQDEKANITLATLPDHRPSLPDSTRCREKIFAAHWPVILRRLGRLRALACTSGPLTLSQFGLNFPIESFPNLAAPVD